MPRYFTSEDAKHKIGRGYTVYVTELGGAVHISKSCRGLRGFRRTGVPDPVVLTVGLEDPLCSGRLPCGTCCRSQSERSRILHKLQSFHGAIVEQAGSSQKPASTKAKNAKKVKTRPVASALPKKSFAQMAKEDQREQGTLGGPVRKMTPAQKQARDSRIMRKYGLTAEQLKQVKRG